MFEGGSGSKENAESCFSWGGVHLFNVSLSLSLSICTLLVKESYIRSQPSLGVGDHAQKSWWPFVVSHTIKWDCGTGTKATL